MCYFKTEQKIRKSLKRKKNHIQESQEVRMSVAQLCSTLCDPMDCSPQGSPVHGISQVRILEWVAIPFSGDLPNPGIEPPSPALQADSLIGVGGKLGPCHYSEGAAFTNVSLAN